VRIGETNEFEVEELTIEDVKKAMRDFKKITRQLLLVEYIQD